MNFPKKARNAAFFAVLSAVYFGFFSFVFFDIFSGRMTFIKRDIVRYYQPTWSFAVQCIREGTLPLWNPYSLFGTPFLANIQSCIFYPPTALFYIFGLTYGFNLYVLMHLTLGCVFTYFWARDCGISKGSAFGAGLAFGFSGFMQSTINLTITLCAVSYFPLILYLFRRTGRERGIFLAALTALALVFQYLAGDPSVVFATVMVLTLLSAWKFFEGSVSRRSFGIGAATTLAKVFALFIGLISFQLLPFVEFLFHSDRSHMGFAAATVWSMSPGHLAGIFFPFHANTAAPASEHNGLQNWLGDSYTGIVVLILAFIALAAVRKNRQIALHAALAALGIFLALGRFNLFYYLFYHFFPFAGFVRYPVRFFFLFAFAVSCLAGFGLDRLLEKRKDTVSGRAKAFALTALGGMAGATLLTLFFYNSVQAFGVGIGIPAAVPFAGYLLRTLIFAAITLSGIIAARYSQTPKILIAAFFALAIFFDLTLYNRAEPGVPVGVFSKVEENMKVVLTDPALFRVLGSTQDIDIGKGDWDQFYARAMRCFLPNACLPFRVCDASAYDSLYLKDANAVSGELIKKMESGRAGSMADFLNVKYVTSPLHKQLKEFKRMHRGLPPDLYRNERVLPRAFFVRSARRLRPDPRFVKSLASVNFKPQETVYLEGNFPSADTAAPSVGEDETVLFTRYSPNHVAMDTKTSHDRWLFFSDAFYPGWKARIDGQPTAIFKANYAFRAIRVPAGTHRVSWDYDPPLLRAGILISLGTLFILVLGLRPRRFS